MMVLYIYGSKDVKTLTAVDVICPSALQQDLRALNVSATTPSRPEQSRV